MTDVYGLRIDPDGTIITIAQPRVDEVVRVEMGDATVVTLRSPHTPYGDAGLLVGWVAEWGRVERLPLNVKAWALYGRSPLVGPVYVALDEREPLPDEWVDKMRGRDWVDDATLFAMQKMLRDMVTLREEHVPEWNWSS